MSIPLIMLSLTDAEKISAAIKYWRETKKCISYPHERIRSSANLNEVDVVAAKQKITS